MDSMPVLSSQEHGHSEEQLWQHKRHPRKQQTKSQNRYAQEPEPANLYTARGNFRVVNSLDRVI